MTESFDYLQPTHVKFGPGRLEEAVETVQEYGTRCLLVTEAEGGPLERVYQRVEEMFASSGVDLERFAGARPNPTMEAVSEGAEIAENHGSEVVLAIGGGSTMDTGKAVALQATHDGTAWNYLFFRDRDPTSAILPVVAVPTTSGTGSHVTKVAVLTKRDEDKKSAIVHPNMFPECSIVDPELAASMPRSVTASTGFDVFTHAFESYINVDHQPYVDMLAEKSLQLIVENLPRAIQDGSDLEARSGMCFADTLGGMCIANVGTTLPHAMGQPISGHCPEVSHGESLAVVYPAFFRYTWSASVERFARVGRILNPNLEQEDDRTAAEKSCDEMEAFLDRIGMSTTLGELGVPEKQMEGILEHCMEFPDIEGNPRVPDRDKIAELFEQCR